MSNERSENGCQNSVYFGFVYFLFKFVFVAEDGPKVGQEVPEGGIENASGEGWFVLETEETGSQHLQEGQHQQAGRRAGGHQLHPEVAGRSGAGSSERIDQKLLASKHKLNQFFVIPAVEKIITKKTKTFLSWTKSKFLSEKNEKKSFKKKQNFKSLWSDATIGGLLKKRKNKFFDLRKKFHFLFSQEKND